jgi:quercetin dioxygenase-like cupin family protein
MRSFALAALLLLGSATLQAQYSTVKKTEPRKWGPAPAAFPKGAQMAVVSGDPAQPAEFTVEILMPDGYRIPPHFHPTDESMEVKKGTFLVGMGDTLDLAKTNAMKPGDKGKVPAEAHHYGAAKGSTVVSVTAIGPFAMTYVNLKDDPRTAQQQQ